MPIDKSWALNCLRHNRNSSIIALASLTLLNSDAVEALRDVLVVVTPSRVIFHPAPSDRSGARFELPLSQFADEYRDDRTNYVQSLEEYLRYTRRNLLKESYEVVQAYCRTTSQLPEFKAQEWHGFSRLMRNCVSHDLHFNFRPYDLSLLPVNFLGVTIDSGLQGTSMRQDHLPPYVAIEIHRQMVDFVESH
jgi:hypothetical protein